MNRSTQLYDILQEHVSWPPKESYWISRS